MFVLLTIAFLVLSGKIGRAILLYSAVSFSRQCQATALKQQETSVFVTFHLLFTVC